MINEENIALVKPRAKKTKNSKKTKIKKSSIDLNDNFDITPLAPKNLKKQISTKVQSKDSRGIYRKISLTFIFLTLILVAAVLYFGFSKLTIVIIPAQEKITNNSVFEIINQASGLNLTSEQIYGVVKQMPVEQTKEFSASGKEVLGEEATGKITIINNYIKNQPLVATTRFLSSDNKLFRLKNTVNVPAGGQVEAEVYADVAKPEMAIGPGKFTIPGLWAGIQDKIYAESKEPMKYSQKFKYIIEQSDIDNAVNQLKNDLLSNAEKQVGQAYTNYNRTLFSVDNNSIVQEVSAKVGEEKEKFSIKMKVMVTAVAFNDDEIYNQVKNKIISDLADDKEISKFDKQEMVFTLVNFDVSQAIATVNVDASAQTVLKDSSKAIKKNNLAGLDLQQLKNYLNSLPEVASYQINFFPSFIKKVPNLVDRIDIQIKK